MGKHADEGLAHGLAAARLGHIAHDDDRLAAARRASDADVDRIRRQLDPSIGIVPGRDLDRPGEHAEWRCAAVHVVELLEDLGIRALLDVGEESLAGRVRQRDRAVSGAHDDGLTHRPDHCIELRGTSMLGLGQALEPDLDLDPLANVPSDGDDGERTARQFDRLQDDLDRCRPTVSRQVIEHDRQRWSIARDQRADDRRHAGCLGRLEDGFEALADQLVAGPLEELAAAPVDLFDDVGHGIEDDDRFDHGVEDHPVAVSLAIRRIANIRSGSGRAGRGRRFWHGSSLRDLPACMTGRYRSRYRSRKPVSRVGIVPESDLTKV